MQSRLFCVESSESWEPPVRRQPRLNMSRETGDQVSNGRERSFLVKVDLVAGGLGSRGNRRYKSLSCWKITFEASKNEVFPGEPLRVLSQRPDESQSWCSEKQDNG
ncbi:hypothetical protein MN608_04890 [Microdochium nivale]|nr:hypothetical protein MN608_04890 [Microdochium nivale]